MKKWLIVTVTALFGSPVFAAVKATCTCEFRYENTQVQCTGEAESGFKLTAFFNAKKNGFNQLFEGREKEYTIVHVHIFNCSYKFF